MSRNDVKHYIQSIIKSTAYIIKLWKCTCIFFTRFHYTSDSSHGGKFTSVGAKENAIHHTATQRSCTKFYLPGLGSLFLCGISLFPLFPFFLYFLKHCTKMAQEGTPKIISTARSTPRAIKKITTGPAKKKFAMSSSH